MAFQHYDVGDVIPVGDTFQINEGIGFTAYAYHPSGMGEGMLSGYINESYCIRLLEINDHDSIVVVLAGKTSTIRKRVAAVYSGDGCPPRVHASLTNHAPHGLICVIPNDVIQKWIDVVETNAAIVDTIKRVTPIIDQYLEIDTLPEHLPTNHKG